MSVNLFQSDFWRQINLIHLEDVSSILSPICRLLIAIFFIKNYIPGNQHVDAWLNISVSKLLLRVRSRLLQPGLLIGTAVAQFTVSPPSILVCGLDVDRRRHFCVLACLRIFPPDSRATMR